MFVCVYHLTQTKDIVEAGNLIEESSLSHWLVAMSVGIFSVKDHAWADGPELYKKVSWMSLGGQANMVGFSMSSSLVSASSLMLEFMSWLCLIMDFSMEVSVKKTHSS